MTGQVFVLGHGLLPAGVFVVLLAGLALLEWFRHRNERRTR